MSRGNSWADAECEYILANSGVKSLKEMSAELGRSIASITYKLHDLRLKAGEPPQRVGWSQSDVDRLLTLCETMDIAAAARVMGVKYSTAYKQFRLAMAGLSSPSDGRAFRGCGRTCPEYCPYDECRLPNSVVVAANTEDGMMQGDE